MSAFFATWGLTILKLLGLGIGLILLCALPFFIPKLMKVLDNLADKIKSEKIRQRVKDALYKLGLVVERLVDAEAKLYQEEIIKIIADGKIENQEIVDLAGKMANDVIKHLGPEINTLKRFFVGDALVSFVTKMITGQIVNQVKARLEEKKGPFPPNGSQ